MDPTIQPVQKQTLAEQVATRIKEAILDGTWPAGEALPTEPQLAATYGVSRAVVRDATRMLAARGLVEAQQGRGVFVTESQATAFGEALLLALRREGATVWDVEQFDRMVFPEVCALAAVEASSEEKTRIAELGRRYLAHYAATITTYWEDAEGDQAVWAQSRTLFTAYLQAIFSATHNALWQLLAQPLLTLRSFRHWDERPGLASAEAFIAVEQAYVQAVSAAIAAGESAAARMIVREIMALPDEAEAAMRETPVGEVTHIKWPE